MQLKIRFSDLSNNGIMHEEYVMWGKRPHASWIGGREQQQTVIFGDVTIRVLLHCFWQLPSVEINIMKHTHTHTETLFDPLNLCGRPCNKFGLYFGSLCVKQYLSSEPSSNVSAKYTSPVGTGVLYVTWWYNKGYNKRLCSHQIIFWFNSFY